MRHVLKLNNLPTACKKVATIEHVVAWQQSQHQQLCYNIKYDSNARHTLIKTTKNLLVLVFDSIFWFQLLDSFIEISIDAWHEIPVEHKNNVLIIS